MKSLSALIMTLFLSNMALAQFNFGGWLGSKQGAQSDGKSITKEMSNAFGTRTYQVYVPKKLTTKPGVVVVLHGCFMTGANMATGTELNAFAEERNFLVVYPEQTYADNTWKCWNWFKPENQTNNDGEASIIADLTKEVIKSYKADSSKVIVTGLSAGSAMAANLLGCYSDLYTGGLLQAGLEFAAAQTESEAHNVTGSGPSRTTDEAARMAVACSPDRKSYVPVVVVHGDADPYVNVLNANRTAEIFEKINAQVALKKGVKAVITRKEIEIKQDGYKFSAINTQSLFDGVPVVEKVIVQKMGHGWSGGNSAAPYMEPRGVKATQVLVDKFFPAK